MNESNKKPNLLILGASGGVGTSLLIYLAEHRDVFDQLILLDKGEEVLSNEYLDHERLDYLFLNQTLRLPQAEDEYHRLLKDKHVDIVLDVTDDETLPLFHATDRAGVNYVNTSINGPKKTHEQILELWDQRDQFNNGVHILGTGMNPGIVNMWARHGIEKFGLPLKITIFEYDSSQTAACDHPMVTWSVKQFLEEVSGEPSIVMAGRDQPREYHPNAIENRINMKPILSPILPLEEYPEGFIVPHEEVVSLSQKYDLPVKFVYAINIRTMRALIDAYRRTGRLFLEDILLGDNTELTLKGADNIGVLLEYPDKRVYYFNSIANSAITGTNATYTQVVTGVIAALLTLAADRLERGAYFVEDLYDSSFKSHIFDKMQVQEFIFEKQDKGLCLSSHDPGTEQTYSAPV
ncbi:MAG TPA: saccharopine dehydrogenase C-terminal domain-containing protein [Candidatus Aminicenantes bacterium]|nr:saccharopine dehydrogenase C-terminal domain-containing protein [Candidatus Aminicenantes bacterium]